MNDEPAEAPPTRDDVDALPGPVLLEFGTDGCGHCRRAQPLIAEALARHPGVRHLRVIDGAGKPLGRTFGVKLWPTLVCLKDGREVARLVRPPTVEDIERGLASIAPADRR
ncbi:MAG: thioredoxin family protein [Burkholderiales bacterium]